MEKVQHLTTKQLAQRLNIHEQTPRKWRMLGIGPKGIKAGRSIRYPISEVEKWEQNMLSQSTAQN